MISYRFFLIAPLIKRRGNHNKFPLLFTFYRLVYIVALSIHFQYNSLNTLNGNKSDSLFNKVINKIRKKNSMNCISSNNILILYVYILIKIVWLFMGRKKSIVCNLYIDRNDYNIFLFLRSIVIKIISLFESWKSIVCYLFYKCHLNFTINNNNN